MRGNCTGARGDGSVSLEVEPSAKEQRGVNVSYGAVQRGANGNSIMGQHEVSANYEGARRVSANCIKVRGGASMSSVGEPSVVVPSVMGYYELEQRVTIRVNDVEIRASCVRAGCWSCSSCLSCRDYRGC